MTNLIPTPKVATGGATGIVTAFVLYELNHRFNIVLSPEESSFLTTALAFAASYLAPHSQPTPEQVATIKQQEQSRLGPG